MSRKRLVLSGLLIVGTCNLAFAQPSATQVRLHIEPQPLDSAINDWAVQTGYQVLIPFATPNGGPAPRVDGTYTPEDALKVILASTDFDYRFVNGRTVSIRRAQVSTGATPQAARAEEPASGRLEEVLVTAQKREERLIDVPISIVALTGEDLQKRRITRLEDLALAVPGLAVQSSGSFQRQIMLRGVSNIFGGASLIGLYLDEASVTSAAGSQLDVQAYDLERVEVLRGPQGTLYGEGAAGGTIRFITRKPQMNGFAMSGDVAALVTEDGASSQRVQGMVNMLLLSNLGLRLAGTFDREGGWMDQPAAGRNDFNRQSLTDVRAKMLWRPASQYEIDFMAVVHRNKAPPNTGEDENGDFTQVWNLTTTPFGRDDFEIFNLTQTYDFDSVRLLGSTTYIDQDKDLRNLGFRYQLTEPGTPLFEQYIPVRPRQGTIFNQEVRLASSGPATFQWTLGAFYRRAIDHEFYTQIFDLPGPPGSPLPEPSPVETKNLSRSWAVFGDGSYKLTERLTLGAGLRHFEDRAQDRLVGQTASFDTLNPRAYAQYKLNDSANLYASAAKGFRSGGLNQVGQPTYGPESVWTYELGTKMVVADRRVSIDAAVFYSDYSNYQIFGLVPPPVALVIISNAGDARIKGVEAALTWRPSEQWSFSVNGEYLDTEFTQIDIDPASSPYAVGDRLDLFPKYKHTFSALRQFTLAGRAGSAQLDYSEQGRSTYRARMLGEWYFNESDVIQMLNFNVGLQWNERISFELFARNLLDDRGFLDPFSNEFNAARARPRTYGMQVSAQFE